MAPSVAQQGGRTQGAHRVYLVKIRIIGRRNGRVVLNLNPSTLLRDPYRSREALAPSSDLAFSSLSAAQQPLWGGGVSWAGALCSLFRSFPCPTGCPGRSIDLGGNPEVRLHFAGILKSDQQLPFLKHQPFRNVLSHSLWTSHKQPQKELLSPASFDR